MKKLIFLFLALIVALPILFARGENLQHGNYKLVDLPSVNAEQRIIILIHHLPTQNVTRSDTIGSQIISVQTIVNERSVVDTITANIGLTDTEILSAYFAPNITSSSYSEKEVERFHHHPVWLKKTKIMDISHRSYVYTLDTKHVSQQILSFHNSSTRWDWDLIGGIVIVLISLFISHRYRQFFNNNEDIEFFVGAAAVVSGIVIIVSSWIWMIIMAVIIVSYYYLTHRNKK